MSRVLVIGSGLARHFEYELRQTRPDVAAYSVDPLLRFGIQERLREAVRMTAHVDPGPDGALRRGAKRINNVRFSSSFFVRHAYYDFGATASAICSTKTNGPQGLPFREKTFDLVLAPYSVPQYSDIADVPLVLDETMRVMKPGGVARFYPFFSQDVPALEDFSARHKLETRQEELTWEEHAGSGGWREDLRRLVFSRPME